MKNKLDNWDIEHNKHNLVTKIEELKTNIKLLDPEFKKDIEKKSYHKKSKQMERNDEF